MRAHTGGTEDGRRSPLHGGYVETGGKRSDPNELVRGLHDAVRPKLYAYERCADAYLRRVKPIR